jgi:hypothetical protein
MAADISRKVQLTAELLQLMQRQQKAREDATFLGWQAGQLDAYEELGERISVLRKELLLADAKEQIEVALGTLPVAPDFDAEPS